jgi:CheY-like chemotaxis protein
MCINHVLVVDDEPELTYTYKTYLEYAGYKVTVANDAQTALELYSNDPADAVITDFNMPSMSGQELLGRLRLAKPNLPAIIVSGFTGAFTQNEDRRTKVFSKPMRLPKLVQCIKTMPCDSLIANR